MCLRVHVRTIASVTSLPGFDNSCSLFESKWRLEMEMERRNGACCIGFGPLKAHNRTQNHYASVQQTLSLKTTPVFRLHFILGCSFFNLGLLILLIATDDL